MQQITVSKQIKVPRLTIKKLIEWCNDQFKNNGIGNTYEVFEIYATRFRYNDYECGACKLVIRYRNKTLPDGHLVSTGSFYCFYKISELQEYLKLGYRLYLKDTNKFGLLADMVIEVTN